MKAGCQEPRISAISIWRAACCVACMITQDDYLNVAETLIRRHGATALLWADLAIEDLDGKGERESADHWRTLRGVIHDLVGQDVEMTTELVLH